MKQRCINIILVVFLFFSSLLFAQNNFVVTRKDFITIPISLQNKIGSGRLLMKMNEKYALIDKGFLRKGSATAMVVVYFSEGSLRQKYPTSQQIFELEQRGLKCYLQTWTPPMDNHPLGFFIAELPIDKLNDVLSLDFVKKLDTAEGASIPQNNNAAKSIKATAAWTKGWTGKGVKVAVLDSGIDTTFASTDLSAGGGFEKKDYSLFPQLNNDVINRITGHGTHVTGIVLGKGNLSLNNVGNGSDAFKGMAPDASLAFLKVGDDTTGNASDAAIIAALNDAVNVYHVQVINMSYGGWDAYHDGSEPVDQKADWCFNQGVVVCFSAGNDATANRHYMGTVPANGETDFIQVNVWDADATKTRPSFNLVWFDGVGTRNNLTMKYYNAAKNEIINVNRALTTESPRGTESQYSSLQQFAPNGNSTFFVKVVNASNVDQSFHIYEDYTENLHAVGTIDFNNASAEYTLGSPSTADHVLSVAAYTSRAYWVTSQGNTRRYNQTLDKITNFSSHGPRVDGAQKPDIAAPGSAVISLRDKDMYKTFDNLWIDNDGVAGGNADYYVMQGTSMASPVCAGAAALLLSKYPSLTPQQVYDSLKNHAKQDAYTGATPNMIYGAGKLDLSFLSGLVSPSDGWVQVNPNGWANQGIPGIAVNAQGNVFVNVGKPWTTDTSIIYRSVDNGSTWSAVKSEPSLAPLAIQKSGTLLTAGRNQGFIYRSVNNGNTWTKIGTPHDYTSIAVRFDDSLLIGTYGQGIFYSVDDGLAWYELNNGLPANAQVPTVAAGGTDTYFALVMTNGIVRLYRYEGSIEKWILSDNGIDTTKHVNTCAVMADGTVFAAVFDRIYRSTDDGKTWQQITILNDYLQYLYAYSNTTIIVGTVSGGVYRSTDKGNSWSSFSDGLTTLNIAVMGSNGNGMLYAGADREKVFRRSIGTSPSKINLIEPANNAAAAPIPTTFRWMNDNRAITYWLQVSAAQDFSTLLINQQGINQLEWQVNIFTSSTQYYWRLCGANNAGAGVWSDTWSFMAAPPLPAVPTLLSPVNLSTNIPVNISFSWSAANGAAWYHIQVSTDVTFTTTVYDQSNISNTYFTVTGLQNNTIYYWRVSAVNLGGASAWSSIWSFTTILAMPTVPTLVSPISGIMDVAIPTTLVWNISSGASSYTLQVGADANFMPPLIFSQSGITDTSKIVSGLVNNATYYWRVNATNTTGTSSWSTVWSFTTSSKTLTAPLLVSPIDGATGISKDTTLIWNAVSGATSYHMQVSNDAAFSTTFFDQNNITTASQQVSGLSNNTKYYWRVNASDGTTTSSWSSVWNFTTIIAPPLAPSLISPIDNAINISLNPTLNWNASATATSYRLQVATSSSFASTIFDQSNITNTFQALSNLTANTKYYWRVNAANAGGTSLWSSVWSFTTASGTGVKDRRALADDIGFEQNYPNPFKRSTTFEFNLPQTGFVQLKIFDVFGKEVATIVSSNLEANTYKYEWNTNDLNAGMYFVRLITNNATRTKKIIVLSE